MQSSYTLPCTAVSITSLSIMREQSSAKQRRGDDGLLAGSIDVKDEKVFTAVVGLVFAEARMVTGNQRLRSMLNW